MAEAEVKTKLTLDDAASASLSKLKSGFESVGDRVTHVRNEMAGMLKQAAAVAIGFQFDRGIESLKELGQEALNAAIGSEKQVKNLAGVLALTDKTGMGFEEATEQASGFKDELEAMAIKAGVSADAVIDAFSTIAERSGKSREEVLKLTEEMTNASKALPGGVGQMAGAFQQLESGIVRPRNALVQMIKQTGVAQGSAKDIAKALSSMVQAGQVEKATALAEAAISRMSAKMKSAPPTFEGLVQSLKDIRENLFESFGMPMLTAIVPHLNNLKKFLMENKDKIEEFAKSMGIKVGEYINKAAKLIQDGFEYLQTHSKEIEESIVKGAKMLMDAVRFIIAHKEEIAIIYGAGQLPGAMSAVGGVAKGAMAVGGALAGGGGFAGALSAAAAATGPLIAFAAAVGSVGLAAYKGHELYKQIQKDEAAGNVARIEMAQRMALETRQLTKEEQSFIDKVRKEGIEEAGGGAAGAKFAQAFDTTLAARTGRMETVRNVEAAGTSGDTATFIQAYNAAIQSGDKQMLDLLRTTLEKSSILQSQMNLSADRISGGLEKMGETLGLNESARERLMMMYGDKAPKPEPPKLLANFNGPITIKQDFRDQDPDRVAVVFRRDMERAASSQIGSKVGI